MVFKRSTMKKFLIVDIIPLIRLSNKAPDFFFYFTKKRVKEGNIVQVEFKKRKIYGYVFKISPVEKRRFYLKEKELYLKPILKIVNRDPLITNNQITLAFWLKNYAAISLGAALTKFFPYKKLITCQFNKNLNLSDQLKKYKIFYKKELEKRDFSNKKTLIIVPQDNYLDYLSEKFGIKNIIRAKISEKKFFELIHKIVSKNKEVFLTTKNGVFLPWQFLDQIIVFEEGSIFYKEFFKEPYFDYRKIFLKFAEINKTNYLAIGNLPSFWLIKNLNLEPKIKIDFQKINFIKFEKEIREFKKTLIFVPQKSFTTKLICQNCHFSLNCFLCQNSLILSENNLYCYFCLKKYDLPTICPNCQQKTIFIPTQKGAEAIYNFLLKINRPALFLKNDEKKIINLFKNSDKADLIGSLYLLNPEISGEAFFFFNFSQFYFSPDIFLKEKFLRILDFFSLRNEKIFLISEILNIEIENKIKDGEIIKELLKEREINKLPPYKRLVILKEGSTNLQKIQNKLTEIKNNLKNKNPHLEIIGPIFARPFKIKKRFFLELILKIEDNIDFNLKKILEDIDIEKIEIDAQTF